MLKLTVFLMFCIAINSADNSYIINELPCLLANGECRKSEDCPTGVRQLTGYCPRQEQNGIKCCLSSTLSCRSRGGECVSFKCPKDLTFSRANDCSQGETCCILVQ
ncbi:U-scoloptoxin(19)-Sm1a-like [Pieris rapae]|uniref:U-scoloptoxin(19)-Sm1a-like n=1 Tax=Pieris rapae TaxID=64459 RepID=UPI001E27FE59|nr:U-scoloptoxin(19)-Sm1a-like [Pieris rapae]